jgi:hypothetical protein
MLQSGVETGSTLKQSSLRACPRFTSGGIEFAFLAWLTGKPSLLIFDCHSMFLFGRSFTGPIQENRWCF